MPKNIPLLILDEVVLPTAETEVGLSDAERDALLEALGPDGGMAAIVARPPGGLPPTSLERKAAPDSPGAIMKTCVFGSASVLQPDGRDDSFRLHVGDIMRGRLTDVSGTANQVLWRADIKPWPLVGDPLNAASVDTLRDRFLRLLLATRRTSETDGAALRRQLGRPLKELEGTAPTASRLWLLADYLFEGAEHRASLVQAESSEFLGHTVEDALELAETGMQLHPRALAAPFVATLVAASSEPMAALEDLGRIVRAFVPLVTNDSDEGARLAGQADDIAEAASKLAADIDKWVLRLAKSARKRPQ